ncbi:MAG TPA: hypothetical protein DIW47_04805 [Bacteroidetes bacterium]|nr:hypothetical protein [Bacteroidota bacterium]
MSRPNIICIFVTLVLAISGCSKDNVWISVELRSIDKIKGVSFQKNFGVIHYIDKQDFDLPDYGEFISASINVEHSFKTKGESTCKVCVLTTIDTICSELYVEKGHRVHVNFENDTLTVQNLF